jgi:anti-anti-sigma factor
MPVPKPPHHFEWEDAGGVAVIRFTTPHLRDDHVIRQMYEQIDQLITAGRTKVLMNFSGLQAFASYAIGKLIVLNDRLQGPAGRLALCCMSPSVAEILDIMRLRKRFNVYDTEREALESFA